MNIPPRSVTKEHEGVKAGKKKEEEKKNKKYVPGANKAPLNPLPALPQMGEHNLGEGIIEKEIKDG